MDRLNYKKRRLQHSVINFSNYSNALQKIQVNNWTELDCLHVTKFHSWSCHGHGHVISTLHIVTGINMDWKNAISEFWIQQLRTAGFTILFNIHPDKAIVQPVRVSHRQLLLLLGSLSKETNPSSLKREELCWMLHELGIRDGCDHLDNCKMPHF